MIAGELAALPTEVEPSETVAQRLAGYLADVGKGWHDATMEERNRLARELFASAIVENRTVVAVEPRPDLLPFFRTVNWCVGGSDGGRIGTFRTFRVAACPCQPPLPQACWPSGLSTRYTTSRPCNGLGVLAS